MQHRYFYRGFTLMELLITLGIIALLIAVLLPAVSLARDSAKVSLCLTNQRQMALAVTMYANENKRAIPVGPSVGTDPDVVTPAGLHWSDTASTKIWVYNGVSTPRERNAIGMILTSAYVPDPKIVFCPGDDDPGDRLEEMKKFAVDSSLTDTSPAADAYSSYFYRQLHGLTRGTVGSVRNNIDELGFTKPTTAFLGGLKFQTLGWDRQSILSSGTRTNHKNNTINVMYFDGHAKNYPNFGDRLGLTDANIAAASMAAYAGIPAESGVYARLSQIAINADYASEKSSIQDPDVPFP